MSTPLVTVLLTTYNQGRWIRDSVESVVQQTYPRWELFVLDNGSTDETAAILEHYRSHPQATVIRYERNTPHTIICNKIIRQARGEFVSFLYGDDYYMPNKLERQVDAFEKLPSRYGVVYAPGFRLVADGTLRPVTCGNHDGDILEALLAQPQFFQPIAPMIRRECLLRYPFTERLFIEGEGIYTRIALRYWYHPITEPVVVMRDHENNLGKEIGPNLERCLIIYEDLFRHPEFPERLRYLKGHVLGSAYRIAGWEMIRRERNYRQARKWLFQAVAHYLKLLADARVLIGLIITSLPRFLANTLNGLLNLISGTPAPPIRVPPTPVVTADLCRVDQQDFGRVCRS